MNIDKICEQLTIDEKIRLLGGVGDWHTYDCNGKIPSIMMTDGPHGIRKLEQEKVGDSEASNLFSNCKCNSLQLESCYC